MVIAYYTNFCYLCASFDFHFIFINVQWTRKSDSFGFLLLPITFATFASFIHIRKIDEILLLLLGFVGASYFYVYIFQFYDY